MNIDIGKLVKKSAQIRIKVLEDAARAGKGHLGGSFSCVELLVALYHGGFLKYVLNVTMIEAEIFL